ncbi:MAG: peptidoglycan editing factor PgeF [Caldilineaceae bacterium]|nr:peptidoglycan editing factor PgeF [Caldilineaceae bacterium]
MQRTSYDNGIAAYAFESLVSLPIQAHVSTRHGGVSPYPWRSLNFSRSRGDKQERVQENFARFCDALHKDPSDAVRTHQVHGTAVARVGWMDAGSRQKQCDALITDAVGLPLFLVFADCVPLVLYDAARHVLGACHAGWRGTVSGVAVATLEAMQVAFGTDAGDVRVGIGPSIGPESYEVGEDVRQIVAGNMAQGESYLHYRRGREANPFFDLWQANTEQLIAAGVHPQNVEVAGIDTACNTEEFFSHRAEGGNCGLFGLLAWLESEGEEG